VKLAKIGTGVVILAGGISLAIAARSMVPVGQAPAPIRATSEQSPSGSPVPKGPTSAPVRLTIERATFTSALCASPNPIQLPSKKTCLSGYVLVLIHLPAPIQQSDLRRDTITINGSALTARKPSLCQVPEAWRPYIVNPPADYLILFYDCQEFVTRLGSTPGVKAVSLAMSIGAGHLLTATGQLTLTEPPKSGNK
jgi:hypothetical protein